MAKRIKKEIKKIGVVGSLVPFARSANFFNKLSQADKLKFLSKASKALPKTGKTSAQLKALIKSGKGGSKFLKSGGSIKLASLIKGGLLAGATLAGVKSIRDATIKERKARDEATKSGDMETKTLQRKIEARKRFKK